MTPEEEALATVDGLSSLRFNGSQVSAEVVDVLTGASLERTIEGASTLTIDFRDDKRALLRSGLLSSRVTTQVDKYSFELVQIRKAGDAITATFEDLAVAALRRHDTPLVVAPGKVTHVSFARRLVGEEKWIKFYVPPGAKPSPARVALTRGTPAKKGQKAEKETTWDAIGRLADERGWRRFVRGDNTVWYTPETVLYAASPTYTLQEFMDGVDFIDFDWDAGKPVASMDIDVRSERWAAPVGTTVQVRDLGPADGKWMVKKISRSLFDLQSTITLEKARPVLPEPKPAPTPKSSTSPDGAADSSSGKGKVVRTGATSAKGFMWPARGPITSGFGQRNGRLHAGTDIGVPVGTPVYASKAGTVVEARYFGADSYGNCVYLNHSDGSQTRYAHLSAFRCQRGQHVDQGQLIALSGNTGRSTGPHLHFEIHIGGAARNPVGYLP